MSHNMKITCAHIFQCYIFTYTYTHEQLWYKKPTTVLSVTFCNEYMCCVSLSTRTKPVFRPWRVTPRMWLVSASTPSFQSSSQALKMVGCENYTHTHIKTTAQNMYSTFAQCELFVSSGTVRVWHSNTYRLENTLNYGMERVWCICGQPGSNSVALGYDEGSIIIKVYLFEQCYYSLYFHQY